MRRHTRIGGTLGPACDDPRTLARMIEAGLDLARVNLAHGEPEDHALRVRAVRRAARRAGARVAILADLQGPRFRVGRLPGGGIDLRDDAIVVLAAGRERAGDGSIPVPFRGFPGELRRGDPILLDDGKLALEVMGIRQGRVRCLVARGGRLADHKGINLPPRALRGVPALTAKDRRDLRVALGFRADWIAASFVRRAADVRAVRRALARAGAAIPVMAKIERAEAVERLDEIVDAADALLVARGDLGAEIPPERVPLLQKRIVAAAHAAGKPVVIATHLLESMRRAPSPTRAEVSDVANAVLDGADVLLLTAETASGAYPAEAIGMLARIVREVELDRSSQAGGP